MDTPGMKPLAKLDLVELREWANHRVDEANGWAVRAEVSRGERKQLTRRLDAIASQARDLANLCDVLVNR